MISSIITIGRFKRLRNIFSNTLYERYGNNIYNNNNGLYKNNKVNSSGRPSNPNSNSETNLYKYIRRKLSSGQYFRCIFLYYIVPIKNRFEIGTRLGWTVGRPPAGVTFTGLT